jgi:hypothetical protein
MGRTGPTIALSLAAAFGATLAAAWAADNKERLPGGAPPQRSTEERPFGGPPPDRKFKFRKAGKTCRTAAGACELDKAAAVGTACSCANGVEGKVE